MSRTGWNERGTAIQWVITAVAVSLAAVGIDAARSTAGEQTAGAGSEGATVQAPPRRPDYAAGEVIVKLRPQQAAGIQALSRETALRKREASLRRLQAKYGLEDKGPVFARVHAGPQVKGPSQGNAGIAPAGSPTVEHPIDLLAYRLLKTSGNVPAVCSELRADPDVEYAQPNYIYHPCRMPNDPDFADQYAHQLIQMEDAWEISTGSRDVVVAIIGTGVDVDHPDLKDNIWVNQDEIPDNGQDDDGNGFVDDVHGWNFAASSGDMAPEHEHETEVAGVIAALGNNGEGVCGVNWQCSVMVLQLSLDYTSDEVAAALDYAAANGARVLNMSFGSDSFGPEGDPVVHTAIDNAYEWGVLLVASAGNSDSSRPNYPAGYPNVMAVASTNGEDVKTGHSSFGVWVDIAAPGTDIVTTDPGGGYVATAGTSFSSPYVAAVAALLFAYRPTLTHMEARAILENTTDPVYYDDVDPNLGYIGTGRVNAYNALLAADESLPLSEIFAPRQNQSFASDVNEVEIRAFVHGESYGVDYRPYGQADWTAVSDGSAAADPNGFVRFLLPNPGVGTYELRLRVTAGDRTHTDRKLFTVPAASDQAHWPVPKGADDPDSQTFYFVGSPLCLDVNGDGRNEIIQAMVDYASYWESGIINIWTEDGNSLPNWPVSTGYAWPSGTAVGDIDGDGDYEVVVACEYDGEVYAYHVESGQSVDGDWPVLAGGWYGWIVGSPVLADLDRDGDSEIVVALDMETTDTDGLLAIQGDGTYLWQRRYTSIGPVGVGDIDRDGDVEIGLCGLGPGLSRIYTFLLDHNGQQIARWRGGSPKGVAFADLDADGTTELVFCTEQEAVAVRSDGSTVWKTRVSDPLGAQGGLSVGDLDGDGLSEICMTTYLESQTYVELSPERDGFVSTRVYAFDSKGKLLTAAGFPKTIMGDPTRGAPLIADIDGDGSRELIVGPAGEPIVAWEADGSVTAGFPMLNLTADVQMTPALEDLDRDGDVELMVPGHDYRFHVIDLPAAYDARLVDWGTSRHDPQNSGWTAAMPRLDSIQAPSEIRPGRQLQVQLVASNPANLPLRWVVGNLPEGAWYDPQSLTLLWKPTADQAFGVCALSFLVTDGVRQSSRSISVIVVPDAIYHASMETNPNWTLDAGWARGVPAGKGSWNRDPNSGRTGRNVLGYALEGDYADNLATTQYATTGPINCMGRRNIRLSFWRWLGIESPYDYACVQVSNDGVNWTNLWTTGLSHVSDGSWQFVEYAVPAAIGDDQPAVYFRWGIGPSDASVTYPGWNIDDVQVTGELIQQIAD